LQAFEEGDLVVDSPDALVQSAEFSHQLCGSFVLIAAQVVHSLDGLGRRLQLIFINVDSLVLGSSRKKGVTNVRPGGIKKQNEHGNYACK